MVAIETADDDAPEVHVDGEAERSPDESRRLAAANQLASTLGP